MSKEKKQILTSELISELQNYIQDYYEPEPIYCSESELFMEIPDAFDSDEGIHKGTEFL